MSRRGGREEVREYEERAYFESDGPAPVRSRPGRVRGGDLLEIDVNTRRERSRDRQPEFLRQQRSEEQPLVLRKREVETFERPIQRRSPPRRRSPSIERERIHTRVVERERERTPSPVERERVRTRVVERTRERSPSPVERERIRTRVVERERERSPEPERYRTRIIERERDRERSREREPSVERTRTTTRIVERERERSPSPVRERERIRTRIVERERERSVSSESSIEAPPEPPIIRAPPIHQEIITHHRHIDHGYDYQPAPTPPPPLRRERPRETTETDIDIYKGRGETEIDIHTSTKRSGREEVRERESRPTREFYDDDVLIERDRERLHVRESHNGRRRSISARRDTIGAYEEEEDYYARRTAERGYIGEAYNGATKKWEIVDVPPGTERVRMDGVGGASQEITWQRYNGVRRSKFIPERDSLAVYDREREYEREEITDRRIALPPRNKYGDMWTEITKDLIVREAIEDLGYDYEETEFFFYVFQYLKYDDIQELVFLSEDIRRARKSRIREIAVERDRMKDREVISIERRREIEPAYDEERIIERDIIYDAPPRRPRGYKESITVRDTRDVREYR